MRFHSEIVMGINGSLRFVKLSNELGKKTNLCENASRKTHKDYDAKRAPSEGTVNTDMTDERTKTSQSHWPLPSLPPPITYSPGQQHLQYEGDDQNTTNYKTAINCKLYQIEITWPDGSQYSLVSVVCRRTRTCWNSGRFSFYEDQWNQNENCSAARRASWNHTFKRIRSHKDALCYRISLRIIHSGFTIDVRCLQEMSLIRWRYKEREGDVT